MGIIEHDVEVNDEVVAIEGPGIVDHHTAVFGPASELKSVAAPLGRRATRLCFDNTVVLTLGVVYHDPIAFVHRPPAPRGKAQRRCPREVALGGRAAQSHVTHPSAKAELACVNAGPNDKRVRPLMQLQARNREAFHTLLCDEQFENTRMASHTNRRPSPGIEGFLQERGVLVICAAVRKLDAEHLGRRLVAKTKTAERCALWLARDETAPLPVFCGCDLDGDVEGRSIDRLSSIDADSRLRAVARKIKRAVTPTHLGPFHDATVSRKGFAQKAPLALVERPLCHRGNPLGRRRAGARVEILEIAEVPTQKICLARC